MKITTLLGTAALGLFALSGTPAGAAEWCAYQGGRAAYENCGYYTYAQCRAAVRGVGGDCRRNPYAELDRGRGYRGRDYDTGYAPRGRWRYEDDEEW